MGQASRDESGGLRHGVVIGSGHIVTRDERRPAPSEDVGPMENAPEPTDLRFDPGSTVCAVWPSWQ
jgi:hypothetical protein